MPARANHPIDKVRQLQRRLYVSAKHSGTRRYHALYDRICRRDVLAEAWRRVSGNGGAAGVDRMTIDAVEQRGVDGFLEGIRERLLSGKYQPSPVRRRYIPKADGKQRPLGIPTITDRVVQAATKLLLEPIFEADFKGCSYGFRPRRSATGALEAIRLEGGRGQYFVVEVDFERFFDTIDHELLMERVARRVSDRRVQKLLRQWLKAGVMEDGVVRGAEVGSPQGGVISPLLANVYLDWLDGIWESRCSKLGTLVRYADDAVVLCRTRAEAEESLKRLAIMSERLKLKLHPAKTRIVELGLGKEGFVFLGCYLRIVRSRFKNRNYLFRWPSPKAMERVRGKIRELTDRRRRSGMKDLREVIADLNPVLRGWGEYFRTGNASTKFQQVDRYVEGRLVRLMTSRNRRRRDLPRPFHLRDWPIPRFVEEFGLHRLLGTIRYPGAHASTRRPSVSRVREIRMHGLKGRIRNPGSQEHGA